MRNSFDWDVFNFGQFIRPRYQYSKLLHRTQFVITALTMEYFDIIYSKKSHCADSYVSKSFVMLRIVRSGIS